MVDRRPLVVDRLRLGPGAYQGVEVARLELVSVGRKRFEVGNAVPGRPDSEDVVDASADSTVNPPAEPPRIMRRSGSTSPRSAR